MRTCAGNFTRFGLKRVEALLQRHTFPASFSARNGAAVLAQYTSSAQVDGPWLSKMRAMLSAGMSTAGEPGEACRVPAAAEQASARDQSPACVPRQGLLSDGACLSQRTVASAAHGW